jgi:membrane protein DedA with SNARE-associated domain
MTESILGLIEDWGIWGVLFSMFIEGSAFPFIGTFSIVTVGLIIDLTWFEIGWISLLGSFIYAIGSYIPYLIGHKLGESVQNRLSPSKRENLEQAKSYFNKYGVWSVAIFSPLHLGNVIPFFAGLSNMNLRSYTLLTMLGIAPSTFLFLSIGRFYNGDTAIMIEKIVDYQLVLLIGLAVITVVYVWLKVLQKKNKKMLNF